MLNTHFVGKQQFFIYKYFFTYRKSELYIKIFTMLYYCIVLVIVNFYLLQLRGLPYTATKEDVIKFLDGVKVRGGDNGILFINNRYYFICTI